MSPNLHEHVGGLQKFVNMSVRNTGWPRKKKLQFLLFFELC